MLQFPACSAITTQPCIHSPPAISRRMLFPAWAVNPEMFCTSCKCHSNALSNFPTPLPVLLLLTLARCTGQTSENNEDITSPVPCALPNAGDTLPPPCQRVQQRLLCDSVSLSVWMSQHASSPSRTHDIYIMATEMRKRTDRTMIDMTRMRQRNTQNEIRQNETEKRLGRQKGNTMEPVIHMKYMWWWCR
jgi:hypothetical protein